MAGNVINKNADCITLREDSSLHELERMGVTKPRILLAADPSLTLPSAPDEAVNSAMLTERLDPKGKYIAFVLRQWDGFEAKAPAIAAAADYAYKNHGLTPVFIPINAEKDAAAAELVTKHMSSPYYSFKTMKSSAVTIGVLSRMSAVVSMRLHGLIFSAGRGVALVGIVYDPKVSAFLRYMGVEHFVDLIDVSESSLSQLIDGAIAGFSPEAQEAAIQHLHEMEKVNRETLKGMLCGE